MDFASYGAEWAMWLKGRPQKVFAYNIKLKTSRDYLVDDDSTLLLEYADATAVIQASWNWPRNKGQVEVYGPKAACLQPKTSFSHNLRTRLMIQKCLTNAFAAQSRPSRNVEPHCLFRRPHPQ